MIGETVGGRYRIERELGRGGMGVVYLAHDTSIDRQVALKQLHLDDEESRQRFMREARLMGGLSHPNIIT
ncbi:MAG: hypothetical protein DCC49_13405, partial [Acidobacteria bacterium]